MYDRIKVSYDPQHMINMVTIKSRFFSSPIIGTFVAFLRLNLDILSYSNVILHD